MNQRSKKILLVHQQRAPSNKLYANALSANEMLGDLAIMCTHIHWVAAKEFIWDAKPGDWMRIWLETAHIQAALFCIE